MANNQWRIVAVFAMLLFASESRACGIRISGAKDQWIKSCRLAVIGRIVSEKWDGNRERPGAKGTGYLQVERVIRDRVQGRVIRPGQVISIPVYGKFRSNLDEPPVGERMLWLLEQPQGRLAWISPDDAGKVARQMPRK